MTIPAPHPQAFGWIKGALSGSMSAVMSTVIEAERESNFGRLSEVPPELHQIQGSLRMIELDAAGRLAQELEGLTNHVQDALSVREQSQGIQVLRRGLEALQRYIDAISRQAAASPLTLTDQINQAREIMGQPAITAYDLFTPPLDLIDQDADGSGGTGARREIPQQTRADLLIQLRRKYRRALLSYLAATGEDADPTALRRMRTLIGSLQGISPLDILRQLWWVAGGLLEGIASGEVTVDVPVKTQLARLDREIARMLEESNAGIAADPPDDLLRRMLFTLGSVADTSSDRIQLIREQLGLKDWFGLLGVEDEEVLQLRAGLRNLGRTMNTAWFDRVENLVSGYFGEARAEDREASFAELERELERLAERAQAESLDGVATLAREIGQTAAELDKSEGEVTRTASDIKIASSILFLRDGVANPESVDLSWIHAVGSHVDELRALAEQTEASNDRAIRLRKVAEMENRHAMHAGARQVHRCLAEIEAVFARFEADPERALELAPAALELYQVGNLLTMVEYEPAATVAHQAAALLAEVAETPAMGARVDAESVAFAIAALGVAADHLLQVRKEASSVLETAIQRLAAVRRELHGADAETGDTNAQPHESAEGSVDAADDGLVATLADIREARQAGDLDSLEAGFGRLCGLRAGRHGDEVSELAGMGALLLSRREGSATALPPETDDFLGLLLRQLGDLADPARDAAQPVDLSGWRERFHDLVADPDEDSADGVGDADGDVDAIEDELEVVIEESDNWLLADELPQAGAVEEAPGGEPEIVHVADDDDEAPGDGIEDLSSLLADADADNAGAASETRRQLDRLDRDLKQIFIDEFSHHLVQMEALADRLDADGEDADSRADAIERLDERVHTLAGNCRNLGFDEAADCAESCLEWARSGENTREDGASGSVLRAGLFLLARARDEIQSDGSYDADLAEGLADPARWLREQPEDAPHDSPESADVSLADTVEEPVDVVAEADDPSESTADETADETEAAIDEEIREIFIEEARDILSRVNQSLMHWREDESDSGSLPAIRREFHTLKGSAAATGFHGISRVSHSLETLLDEYRFDEARDSAEFIGLLEEMHDGLAAELGFLDTGGTSRLGTLQDLITAFTTGEADVQVAKESPREEAADSPEDASEADDEAQAAAAPEPEPVDDGPDARSGVTEAPPAVSSFSDAASAIDEADHSSSPDQAAGLTADPETGTHPEPGPATSSHADTFADTEADAADAPRSWMPEEIAAIGERNLADSPAAGSLRIHTTKLAELINASGELGMVRTQLQNTLDATRMDLDVLRSNMQSIREGLREIEVEADAQIRSRPEQQTVGVDEEFDPLQLDRYSRLQAKSRELAERLEQLAKIERELGGRASDISGALQQQLHLGDRLQSGLMGARMVAVGEYLPRLRYLLRETARQSGKQIELRFQGGDIQVDRQVIESMMAPFEHMIRNAVVHGIEPPDERTAAGKKPGGVISIGMAQQGSELVVNFSDDGRGLALEKLHDRAAELGLLDASGAVSDVDLLQLITQPGYSTTETLSMEAGRGVGMDVVYQAVRDLGGSMSMSHTPGEGVGFHFRLPVTLAVTQALLVRVGAWRFAFRSRSIERLLRLSRSEIDHTDGVATIQVEEARVPLISLRNRLDIPEPVNAIEYLPVVLVRLADRLAAFEVDEFVDSIDIVSKNAGQQLLSIPEFSGVTVLPDSSIILILDPEAFVERLGEVVYTPDRAGGDTGPAGLRKVLVVDDSLVVRRVMQKDLEADGLEVETATDGVHALEVLEKSSYDIALVDIEMPRMNGYELLQRLRADARYAKLPVIIITSRSGEQHRHRALELGADGYITKPYDIGQLDQMMREAVAARHEVH